MIEDVKKILEMYTDRVVLSILGAKDRYIVSVCNRIEDIGEATECFFAVDKETFKTSEYSYFNNRDEYLEACDNVLYKHDEITHHGIPGMKWGVRRYQNKDGTLTAKGKQRYNEELAKVRQQEKVVKNKTAVKGRLDRLAARQKAVADKEKELDGDKKKFSLKNLSLKKGKGEDTKADPNAPKPKKKMSEMNDEELANAIRRVQMEKQYTALTTEEKVARGDGFVKKFMKESVEPAAIDAGRSLIRDKLLQIGKDKLGLSDKAAGKTMEDLNKEMKQLQIDNLKQTMKAAAVKAAQETSQTKVAQEHKQTVEDFKSNPTGKATPLSTSKVSSGEKTAVQFFRKPVSSITNSSNVSAGESFVGRYDRAGIAAIDDE